MSMTRSERMEAEGEAQEAYEAQCRSEFREPIPHMETYSIHALDGTELMVVELDVDELETVMAGHREHNPEATWFMTNQVRGLESLPRQAVYAVQH